MNYYFIDYENTGENGLSGIQNLDENSTVAIFYSQNVGRLSFDMHQILCCVKAKLEYHKVNTATKNALDFQLSSYLGYLISQHSEDTFYIVSKDNGYHAVLSFWPQRNIRQLSSISLSLLNEEPAQEHSAAEETLPAQPEEKVAEQPAPQPEQPAQENKTKTTQRRGKKVTRVVAKKAQPADELNSELLEKISRLIDEKEVAEHVTRMVSHYKTKLGVNNAIMKTYGSEKAGEIYKKIKPLLKDKKGN